MMTVQLLQLSLPCNFRSMTVMKKGLMGGEYQHYPCTFLQCLGAQNWQQVRNIQQATFLELFLSLQMLADNG